jgi:hypothetical protein
VEFVVVDYVPDARFGQLGNGMTIFLQDFPHLTHTDRQSTAPSLNHAMPRVVRL